MSTAAIARPPAGGVSVFNGIDWRRYLALLRTFEDSPRVRLTYDHGSLEIMSPSLEHDDESRDFHMLVLALAQDLGLPFRHGGSTTLKRRAKKRGLEADECFWLKNAPAMAGKPRLDLRRDPPPDLAVEIDVSRSSMDRLAIYASLGVPEVWRWHKGSLTFLVLRPKRSGYDLSETSLSFPGLRPSDLEPFLQRLRAAADQGQVDLDFRDWLRLRAVAPPSGP